MNPYLWLKLYGDEIRKAGIEPRWLFTVRCHQIIKLHRLNSVMRNPFA